MTHLSSTEAAPRGLIDFRPALSVVGVLLTVLGTAMLIPAIIDLYFNNPDWVVFAGSAILTGFVGMMLWITCSTEVSAMTLRQAFLMTTLSWIALATFGSLPFIWSELNMSVTDAFFESMSGLTTTGATVMTGLDNAPPGILFWRALQQWMGGLGIIVMAVAVLPLLQIGGMQMFKAEAFDTPDKMLPRATQISASLTLIYLGLSVLCALAYLAGGMRVFDAIAHSMTTIATGGLSTHDASMDFFESQFIELIAVVFMILGSLPFMLYIRVVQGRPGALFSDAQVRTFLGILFVFVGIITALLIEDGFSTDRAIVGALFNVTSIMTGTGYTTHGYDEWGPIAITVFFAATFLGGCAGSTSCGIKTFRIIVVWEDLKQHLQRIVYPSAIAIKRYNGRPLRDDVSAAVQSFIFIYMAIFVVMAIALSLTGLDMITALSGSATAISNVGPGLGSTIGPSTNFGGISDAAKWILSTGMLVGRLELFTILVLFIPAFWR